MAKSRSQISNHPLRISVDTGGTFTDCVWIDRGKLRLIKVFSTPDDPSQAIAQALSQIAGPSTEIILLHGTTVGTNTLLQRKGARVAFVTTAGFEDSIEIGRQNRPKLYDLTLERIQPLVEAGMRFGISERVSPDGKVLQKPASEDLRMLARDVHTSGAEAIAVSTLFGFANPDNERAIGRVLEELGLLLSLSHQILPEFREYERASAVTVNAYLQPVMQHYLQRLDVRLRQQAPAKAKAPRVFVMQSNGGITSLESASHQPVRTVLSGPAGGVVGATAMARLSGFERIITLDMGGTSTDVALVKGKPQPGNDGEVAGVPVRVPMLDIHTVGAGGGSLARFDAGGALRVGPESAGADPGPICYGRGTQPTVTDANLLLGRLLPDRFLGGTVLLDLERTRALTAEWLRDKASRMSPEQLAGGIIRVVNANMERALRVVSIERGYDPREFVLVSFGGAGGLHGCELAHALGIPKVVVPLMPGALSAYGILSSDIVKDYSRTLVASVTQHSSFIALRRQFEVLKERARREFREEGWSEKVGFQRSADLRYRGQGFELNVPFTAAMAAEFHCQHEFRYGYSHPERDVELVTIRVRASIRSPRVPAVVSRPEHSPTSTPDQRKFWFAKKKIAATIHVRENLPPGKKFHGPAVIAEYSATTVIPPGASFSVDRQGNLLIEINKKGRPVRRPREDHG